MKKKSYAQRLLPWIVVAIVSYTVAAFVLQFVTQVEISSTLTTAYFTFWTVEILAIASIKNVKEKRKSKQVEEESEEYIC